MFLSKGFPRFIHVAAIAAVPSVSDGSSCWPGQGPHRRPTNRLPPKFVSNARRRTNATADG